MDDNFDVVHKEIKKHAQRARALYFFTLRCSNCANFNLIVQSDGSSGMVDFRQVPWPLKGATAPDNWPEDVGRYWVQSKKALQSESWDAAAMTIRSSMQLALRHKNAVGGRLVDEVKDLVGKGVLPPLMGEWATEVRLLGNDGTHPNPGAPGTSERDAKDAMRFLDFLLECLFTLPHRIGEYRNRPRS